MADRPEMSRLEISEPEMAMSDRPLPINRRAIPDPACESMWLTEDGAPIRRIDWPGAPRDGEGLHRGSILFLPGRADFYEKYLETLDGWHRQGWRVTALDWRWQAGSGRFRADPKVGDVADFSIWINDLASFWRDWTELVPGPHVLVGHSMGGHLVLRTVAEGLVRPDALVLSAPMLGFVTAVPEWLQLTYAGLMCRLGDPGRMAWTGGERPGEDADQRARDLTHDPARYADELWWRSHRPQLDLGPASWHWVRKACESLRRLATPDLLESVNVPVLLLAARHDALVSLVAIERAAARLPDAELCAFGEEAAHEILRECDAVRERVLATIADFLDRKAPRSLTR